MPEGPTGAKQVGLETAASRPSKTNCTSAEADLSAEDRLDLRTQWWKRKNELVEDFIEERPERAARPISVRDDHKLRIQATQEKIDTGRRGASWSDLKREFLGWYNGYRNAHLLFTDPDGNTVRGQMPNSHQPRYGDRYYGRIKGFERQMLKEYHNPTVVLLSLTGSMKNAHGGWRCPCDHLLEVKSSFRPDSGRGVYHKLREVLDGKPWEYALVVEKHKNGYGHIHVAVFVDGDVSEADFRPVIDKHLEYCDIAAKEAHDYFHPDDEKRPISVRDVATDRDTNAEDYNGTHGDGPIGNLGSYLGEYIGSHGKPLFERDISELSFRAVLWATGTQKVRFSTGANEMIRKDREQVEDDELDQEPSGDGSTYGLRDDVTVEEIEDPETDVSELMDGETDWSLQGIGRVDEDGETVYDAGKSGVEFVTIEDARHLDPPKQLPPTPPQPRVTETELSEYAD
jgi:hypothetical protein